MLVLAGGGLVGVGALTIYGALTGRLAAILAAVFRPSDLEEDGYSSAGIKQSIGIITNPSGAGGSGSSGDPTLGGILNPPTRSATPAPAPNPAPVIAPPFQPAPRTLGGILNP